MLTGWIALVILAVAQAAAPQKAPAAAPAGTQQVAPLQAQVMLDRAGFSPGAIDGRMGANTKKALAAFHAAGKESEPVEATTRYKITAEAATAVAPLIAVDIDEQHRKTLAHALVGLAEGASRRLVELGDEFDPDEIAREVSALAWAGLRAVQRKD